ncbi:chemotaxis protein CheW [Melioribacter sp. OK-6-Me]|uniref:chemotaxis protein CheW n=1 Tax=unclassified Melioribacter TaxID=2627329 RepID=UPI003EDAC19F
MDKNIRILLVEDAGVMRQMEIKTLNSLGYVNIVEAENGVHAVEYLKDNPEVDLIISDWNMPQMDGFELLKWVRENQSTSKIPFLMATGRGEKKEVEKANEAGVSSFISKPFNKDELQEKINEAFGIKTEDKNKKKESRLTSNGKVRIKAIHIQITDHLTLGVMKHLIKKGELNPKHFELETECMPSWNAVAKALEEGSADVAFILAPLAMDLYNYGVPLKLVLFAHKNGSCCVRNKTGEEESHGADFFRGKSFYIPHTMSIHNMLGHIFFKNIGLNPGVTGQKGVDVEFEVVAPIKMPEFLAGNPDASGYLVAEPLGTKAIASGIAELQFLSSELWENHPCCVVTFQEELINNYPEAVKEFTEMLVYSGKFIEQKPSTAAEIAVEFLDPKKELGLKVPILKNVLTEPKGIKTNNLYPVVQDLDFIQHYMHDKMGIGSIIDLNKFVDKRFADQVCNGSDKAAARSYVSEIDLASKAKALLVKGNSGQRDSKTKAVLNMEGKYLRFTLGNEHYGIEILKIIEIIRLFPITPVPNTSSYVKGVINLRGNIVPVIDLRLKLNMPEKEYDDKTRIIIVEDEVDGLLIRVGLIVDEVEAVYDVKASEIENAPDFGNGNSDEYIMALAKTESAIFILLNMGIILKPEKYQKAG